MQLSYILQSRKNNLDLLRVFAALLVIYGHAPAFVDSHHPYDFVAAFLNFDYSGSLAVKFFFLLSGLLVTSSLLAHPQLLSFLLKRAARIFPGLIVCLCISVFVVGPLFTQLDVTVYFSHGQTWQYLVHNTLLYPLQWHLPGVFIEGKTPVVNGSLWTLPLEVLCYLSLAIFSVLILKHQQKIASLLLLIVICIIFLGGPFWPNGLLRFKESLLPGGCFCIGVLAAVHARHIVLDWRGITAGFILTLLLWETYLQQLVFYCALFYLCLYLSGTRLFVQTLRLPGDPSYGIYIYGFLIQQCLANLFPEQGILFNQVVAAIMATAVGYLSWYFVEKPAMRRIRRVI